METFDLRVIEVPPFAEPNFAMSARLMFGVSGVRSGVEGLGNLKRKLIMY
jgi:hypothetical protein